MKIVIVGAGSFQFGPKNIADIYQSELLKGKDSCLMLMDINSLALDKVYGFAQKLKDSSSQNLNFSLEKTTNLDSALDAADFVITAIEQERYKYWSQDFHVPRDFGFSQIYGENGGPGGMFHALRNFSPMLHIAKRMEIHCPNAWLLNFTNPESKIVQLLCKESKIKVLGLCHGVYMGVNAISDLLRIPKKLIEYRACGLNHFGWFTNLKNKTTGEDLYSELKKKELSANLLAHWDELALPRILFRTFGLWPYPGANHCGEYIGWAGDFLAGSLVQFFHDAAVNEAWDENNQATFIYSMEADISQIELFNNGQNPKAVYTQKKKEDKSHKTSNELLDQLLNEIRDGTGIEDDENAHAEPMAVEIMEALALNKDKKIATINYPNRGALKGLPDSMVIEASAEIKNGIVQFQELEELPLAINEMVRLQGVINELLAESYMEKSRKKLLQAVMLDPTTPSYKSAVNMINRMFSLQQGMLPAMKW